MTAKQKNPFREKNSLWDRFDYQKVHKALAPFFKPWDIPRRTTLFHALDYLSKDPRPETRRQASNLLNLASQYSAEQFVPNSELTNPRDLGACYQARLHWKKEPGMYALFTDTDSRVVGEVLVEPDYLDEKLFNMKALEYVGDIATAYGLVFVRYIPGELTEPSEKELEIIQSISRVTEFELLDVLHVSPKKCLSFYQKGYLSRQDEEKFEDDTDTTLESKVRLNAIITTS